ncbi:PEP-CTERM sorting domain-containing protein [Halochromatium glycolicum]|uniref:Ice-binding protein C-terminal domain-containing protein n=1 Tax=Halochromatium glycolicum TaxID=85075 RepID=A0AAJ0U1M9_9GAMM|nr:PEP-CTERM sorting domain-containing protein [Halochromatium glycolicum]MBK1703613.1 hypothetical protein [Halochromatium glycolicum]
MSRSTLIAAVVAAGLIPAGAAQAELIRYTINNGTFADGGTYGGFFDFDTDTDTIGNFAVSVAGGNTTAFPEYTYVDENTTAGAAFSVLIDGDFWTGYTFGNAFGPILRATDIVPLGELGTDLSMDLGAFPGNIYEWSRLNGSNLRDVAEGASLSGEILPSGTVPVPAPAALALFGIGLAGMVAARSRRWA